MNHLFCQYCGKVKHNKNSLVQHEIRCPENSERTYVNGKTGKKGGNQFTKAKANGVLVESKKKYDIQDILQNRYNNYPTNRLKNKLISEGLLKPECAWCGITDTWNGKPITLQLDHINGINNDHRIENLRILCPNCHSQTETWCGRGKKNM